MFISLIHNLALLVILTVLFGLISRKFKGGETEQGIYSGLLFAGVAIAGMLIPHQYAPGIIYDGRSIVLSMAGFFGGGITAVVSIVVTGLYRIYLGGGGLWAGLATIIGCTLAGLVFRRLNDNRPEQVSGLQLYAFAILVHILMLASQMLVLPWPSGLTLISLIWLPVLLLFPFGTLFIGLLLGTEVRRLENEQRLADNKALLRSPIRTVPDMIWLKDPNGRYLICNKAFERLVNSKEPDILGRTDYDLFDQEQASSFREYDRQAIAAGEPCRNEEWFTFSDDGSHVYLETIKTPVLGSEGHLVGVLGIARDMTSRHESEQALQQERDNVRRYFDLAKVMFAVLDIEGRIVQMNPKGCEILGYEQADMIGLDWFETFVPERLRDEVRGVFQMLLTGDVVPVECYENPVLRKDGEERVIAFQNTLLRNESDQLTGILISGEDITDRRQQQEQLRSLTEDLEKQVQLRTLDVDRARLALLNLVEDLNSANLKLQEIDRLKSMFIASMSHELRTPLNSIIGFSSILIHEWVGLVNEEQKKNLASILRSGKHLLSLINDVIDVSKIEAGMIEVNCDDFDLLDVLKEVEETFAKEAQEKKLSLQFQILSLPMQTDRRRLLQSLFNLVSNALKFTESGGVTVRTLYDEGEGEVVLTVIDTGIGIAPDDQGKLFHPFIRIPSHLSAKVLGTGLGLYLTKKIVVEILQGRLCLTSEVDRGSSFSMTIPVRIEKKRSNVPPLAAQS